jgi:hypothetical protein
MVAYLDIFPRLDLAPPQNESKVGFQQTAMEVNQSKSNSYQFCTLAQHDSVSRIF